MRDAVQPTRWALSLCLAVLSFATGCVAVVPAGSPPPCPEWSDAAILELEDVAPTHPALEEAVGRQVLHYEQINAMRAVRWRPAPR